MCQSRYDRARSSFKYWMCLITVGRIAHPPHWRVG
jgi:hypothetical protein